jgi:hypothetical protein
MALVHATIRAVRKYKQHKAEKARLGSYDSALASLDLNSGDAAAEEITYLQQQAIEAKPSPAARGCCGRQSRDCATCGRVNASACHQRKCSRRKQGGGCCGSSSSRKRRQARAMEVATINPEFQALAAAEHDVEKDVGPRAPAEHSDSDSDSNSNSKGGFKRRNEKEIEAGYGGIGVGMGQVPTYIELPPYKG